MSAASEIYRKGVAQSNAMRLHQGIVTVVAMVLIPITHAAEYTSAKPLLLQAIDAPNGRAQGEIVGQIADRFRETTKSTAPVIAEVSTIKSFKQEGCRRLNIRLKQANVMAKEGKPVEFAVDYGINLCRDGSPPTEGMDLEKVRDVLLRH
jgi:hypothetical protein